jgi:hypothetical protein
MNASNGDERQRQWYLLHTACYLVAPAPNEVRSNWGCCQADPNGDQWEKLIIPCMASASAMDPHQTAVLRNHLAGG